MNEVKCEVYDFSYARKFEREQGCDVYPIPSGLGSRTVGALDEAHTIPLSPRPMILRNLHQAERRVLVLISGFNQEDILIRHALTLRLASYIRDSALAIEKLARVV